MSWSHWYESFYIFPSKWLQVDNNHDSHKQYDFSVSPLSFQFHSEPAPPYKPKKPPWPLGSPLFHAVYPHGSPVEISINQRNNLNITLRGSNFYISVVHLLKNNSFFSYHWPIPMIPQSLIHQSIELCYLIWNKSSRMICYTKGQQQVKWLFLYIQ